MPCVRNSLLLLVLSLLCACGPLVADKTVRFASGVSYPLGKLASGLAVGGIAFLIYDPLAPNWEIQETPLSEDTYSYELKMKRYHTGGAGESLQVLRRRAAQVQRERGFGGYELLEYSEGIESKTLGAQRYAVGTIRLNHPPVIQGSLLPLSPVLTPAQSHSTSRAEVRPLPSGTQ